MYVISDKHGRYLKKYNKAIEDWGFDVSKGLKYNTKIEAIAVAITLSYDNWEIFEYEYDSENDVYERVEK